MPTDIDEFDADGNPIMRIFLGSGPENDAILNDLDIDPDLARHNIPHGDWNFTKCGRELCHASTHFCVRRTTNTSVYGNPHLANLTTILETHAELEYIAGLNDTDDVLPPDPLDDTYIQRINETCSNYTDEYFQGFLDAGVFQNHYLWYSVYKEPIPRDCILWEKTFRIRSNEVGCCPHGSAPCGSGGLSFESEIPAEVPQQYSIHDPIIGCTMPGEECCASETICPVGFKCCVNHYRTNGVIPPLIRYVETVLKNASISEQDLADAKMSMLRPALLAPLINDPAIGVSKILAEHPYFLSSLDAFPMCCPKHTFSCQAEHRNPGTRDLEGKQFYYYCSLDPYCMQPSVFSHRTTLRGNVVRNGVPTTPIEDAIDLDYDSSGTFSYNEDITETYFNFPPDVINGGVSFPFVDRETEEIVQFDLNPTCYVDVRGGNDRSLKCGMLAGTLDSGDDDAEESPPINNDPVLELLTEDFLSEYPIPEAGVDYFPGIAKFDILGIEVVVNATSIHDILSPLEHWFLRFSDFTEQVTGEAYYGETFKDFPPPSDDD